MPERTTVGGDLALLCAAVGRPPGNGLTLGLAARLLSEAQDMRMGSVAVPCRLLCGSPALWFAAVAMYRAQGIRLIALASSTVSSERVEAFCGESGNAGMILGPKAPSRLDGRGALTLFLPRESTARVLADPDLPALFSRLHERPYVYAEDPDCGVDLLVGADRVGYLVVAPPANWRSRDATRALLTEAAAMASVKGLAAGAWVLSRTALAAQCPTCGALGRECRGARR